MAAVNEPAFYPTLPSWAYHYASTEWDLPSEPQPETVTRSAVWENPFRFGYRNQNKVVWAEAGATPLVLDTRTPQTGLKWDGIAGRRGLALAWQQRQRGTSYGHSRR